MSPSVENIIVPIDTLTPAEQGELTYEFLCSFEPSPNVSAKWEAEVNRRWAETRSLQHKGIPAQEVFEKLRQSARM